MRWGMGARERAHSHVRMSVQTPDHLGAQNNSISCTETQKSLQPVGWQASQPAWPLASTEEKGTGRGASKRRKGGSVQYRDAGRNLKMG